MTKQSSDASGAKLKLRAASSGRASLDDRASPAEVFPISASTSSELWRTRSSITTSSHLPTQLKMASSVPLQIAETIQTASINRAPSPSHDLNPSTAASEKQPIAVPHSQPDTSSSISLDKYEYDNEDGIDGDDEEDEEDIPYDALRPMPRRGSFPPLPDLRFEQSYLSSISRAESNWQVAFITLRDQVRYRQPVWINPSTNGAPQ